MNKGCDFAFKLSDAVEQSGLFNRRIILVNSVFWLLVLLCGGLFCLAHNGLSGQENTHPWRAFVWSSLRWVSWWQFSMLGLFCYSRRQTHSIKSSHKLLMWLGTMASLQVALLFTLGNQFTLGYQWAEIKEQLLWADFFRHLLREVAFSVIGVIILSQVLSTVFDRSKLPGREKLFQREKLSAKENINPVQIEEEQEQRQEPAALEVMKGDKNYALPLKDILWVKSCRNYMEIEDVSGQRFLKRQSLSNLYQQLKPFGFIQIHRSTLVNQKFCGVTTRVAAGKWQLTLHNGQSLNVSRSFIKQSRS